MEKELAITTEAAYQEAMITMYELMERGNEDLTAEETEQLKAMQAATEKYEADYL